MEGKTGPEGLILAAGSSTRAGAFKPALPVGGMPMVCRCLEGMRAVCDRVVVVGGYRCETLRGLVGGHPGVEIVENREWQRGMFVSLKAGVARMRGGEFFVLPVDVPLVPPSVYLRLLQTEGPAVTPEVEGRRGHPVLIRQCLIREILSEPDESSLRAVLRRAGAVSVRVDSREILRDIDTPEEYRGVAGWPDGADSSQC